MRWLSLSSAFFHFLFSAPLPCDRAPQPYSHIKTVPHSHGPPIWPSACLPASSGPFSAPLPGEQKHCPFQCRGLLVTALPQTVPLRGFQRVGGRGPLKRPSCCCIRGGPFHPQSWPLTGHSDNTHISFPLLQGLLWDPRS